MCTIIAILALVALFASSPAEAARRRPPPPPGLQVVDAHESIVGYFTGGGCFVRQVDQYWVDICGVQVDGTAVNEGLPTRYFLEPGCQGTAFIESFSGALLSRSAHAAHGNFEFVGDPVTTITVASWQFQTSSADNTWMCINTEEDLGDGFVFPAFDVRAGPLHAIPLSTLGVPPFQIQTSP